MRRRLELAGAALVAVGLVEIVLVILLAKAIGWPLTLILVLITTILGLVLLRREGMRAYRRFRDLVGSGRPPGAEVTGGLLGLVGAILLIVPGLLTDIIGLALMIPPVRRLGQKVVQRNAERRMSPQAAGTLFGPRRVKIRRGPATRTGASGPTRSGPAITTTIDARPIEPSSPVEGEIVEP
jgi:UPF0716 protein FxsA